MQGGGSYTIRNASTLIRMEQDGRSVLTGAIFRKRIGKTRLISCFRVKGRRGDCEANKSYVGLCLPGQRMQAGVRAELPNPTEASRVMPPGHPHINPRH